VALILVGFSSCSSAPRTPDTVTDAKDQAAEYAEFGNRYFQRGNYSQALRFFELSLRENTSVDNRGGIALAYNSIGNVYLAAGDTETAEDSFTTAYEIALEISDSRLLLQSATHLGEVALRRQENGLAMEFFQQALAAQDDTTRAVDLAILYHNIATVHSREPDFERALEYLQAAMDINQSEKRLPELASNYYMLASVYSRRQRYDEALQAATRALELDKQTENSVGIAADLKALGLISRRAGSLEASLDYLRRSLEVVATIGLVDEARSLLGHLATVSRELGREADATQYEDQLRALEENDR